MFRNLTAFRLTDADAQATLCAALVKQPLRNCGATERSTAGFIAPRQEHDAYLAHPLGAHRLIALGVDEKVLPAASVRTEADKRLQQIEKTQGYRPGRKQTKEVREAVEQELLPKALLKRRITYAALAEGWLLIDTATPARADELLEALKRAAEELPLTLARTTTAPGSAMTQWLAAGEAPAPFSIDRDCVLESPVEERPKVRYTRHNLDSEEVRKHIAEGKQASQLALTWRDRISFTLTAAGPLRKIAFLDLIQEEAERQSAEGADLFDAQWSLAIGEILQLQDDLHGALGGLAQS